MANGRVREYIGARYVPIFADPVIWDDERAYDPLTMVQYSGETYMSKQYVPIGAPLPTVSEGQESNEFWVHMSNWNAQVEAYREEVMRYAAEVLEFDGRIDTLEDDLPTSDFDSTNTVKKYIDDEITDISNEITSFKAIIPSTNFDSTNTVKKYIDDEITDVEDIIPSSSFTSTNTVKKYIDDKATAINNLLPASSFSSVNTVKKYIDKVKPQKNNQYERFLLFGDSWCTGEGGQLFTRFVELINPIFSKNFGVGGATIQGLATQITTAAADTSFNNSDITLIYIVAGTNNVYWNNAVTFDEAISVSEAFKTTFPNAKIHYFPNNSRTQNGGRNERYVTIMNGLGYNGNIIIHSETLTLPFYGNFQSYSGSGSVEEVQHLSYTGYNNFAFWAHSLANGADFSNYPIKFSFPMIWPGTSSVTGNAAATFYGNISSGVVSIRLSELTFKSGYSSSNPGRAHIQLPPYGANVTTPICLDDQFGYCTIASENASEPIMCAAYATGEIEFILKSGVNVSTIELQLPISNYINLKFA